MPSGAPTPSDWGRVLAGGRAWLWRSADGRVDGPIALTEQYDSVDDLDLSPDGRWAAVVGEWGSVVRLFDVDRPAKPRLLSSPIGAPRFVSFSPDGRRLLAGTRAHDLAVWDLPRGDVVWSERGTQPSLDCAERWAAFLPDGNTVAMVGDGGDLTVLDLRSRAKRAVGAGAEAVLADPEADAVEVALLARARGGTSSGGYLDELSFESEPDLLAQPLEEDDLARYLAQRHRDVVYARPLAGYVTALTCRS